MPGAFRFEPSAYASSACHLFGAATMVITISSIKGGVGKSSVVILLANCLAARGYKVLVIDMDLNNTVTIYYTVGMENVQETWERKNIVIALAQGKTDGTIIDSRIDGVSVIPSSLNLCDMRGMEYRNLKKTIAPAEKTFDFILIDTSPTYDNLVKSAIHAADAVISPAELTEYNCNMTKYLMTKIAEEHPEKFGNTYILFNKWNERYQNYPGNLQSQVEGMFRQTFNNILSVKMPLSGSFNKYTHFDEKLRLNDRNANVGRMVKAVNALCDMISDEKKFIEVF